MKRKIKINNNVNVGDTSYKHKVFFTDYMFKCTSSFDEMVLLESNKRYAEKKNNIIKAFENKMQHDRLRNENFIGLVNYIPRADNDITKSADIVVYMYNHRTFRAQYAYQSVMNILTDFIDRNKLKEISLCGIDVRKMAKEGYDMVADLSKCESLRTINISA